MEQNKTADIKKETKQVRLIFASKKYSFYAKYVEKEGYEAQALIKWDNFFVNAVWEMVYRVLGRRVTGFYNPRLKDYDGLYIVFDARIQVKDLRWLKENNPKARLVFCYWNPIASASVTIEDVRETGCEIWSYGEKQCEKYGVKQALSFYCKSMYEDALKENGTEKWDLIFAGKDKGRRKWLHALVKDSGWEWLNCRFYFIRDHVWQFYKKGYEKRIGYNEVQCMQAKAKAILELTPSQDVDITMRTLDAMVLGKKLVTNSKEAQQREYYHPNNIYILGVDEAEMLASFLETEYQPVLPEIIQKYELSEWIKRIEEDRPVNERDIK